MNVPVVFGWWSGSRPSSIRNVNGRTTGCPMNRRRALTLISLAAC